jgi:ribonuclease HII
MEKQMAKKSTPVGPPTFAHEKTFWIEGLRLVAGIDEAGRGPLAGPVVAAAVILDPDNYPARLNDSKKLTDTVREQLFDEITESALVSVGIVDHAVIDRINIRQATFEAMRQASLGLPEEVDAFIVDGNAIPPGLRKVAKAVVSGDALSLSVAAASIVAKVTRDRMMREFAAQFPSYGFEVHMGYPTRSHVDAIKASGPSPIHRMTFGPLKALAVV